MNNMLLKYLRCSSIGIKPNRNVQFCIEKYLVAVINEFFKFFVSFTSGQFVYSTNLNYKFRKIINHTNLPSYQFGISMPICFYQSRYSSKLSGDHFSWKNSVLEEPTATAGAGPKQFPKERKSERHQKLARAHLQKQKIIATK